MPDTSDSEGFTIELTPAFRSKLKIADPDQLKS